MIEQQGRVIGLDGERAMVRVGPASGCSACDRGQGCGAGVFGRLLQRRAVVLHVPNELDARPGDVVRVGIPEPVFLRLVTRLYLLPLLGALAGAAIGHHLGTRFSTQTGAVDLATAAGAAAGLALALPRWRPRARTFDGDTVRLVDVCGDSVTAACGLPDAGAGTAANDTNSERNEVNP